MTLNRIVSKIMLRIFVPCVLIASIIGGCTLSLKNSGRSLTAGALEPIEARGDTLVGRLTGSAAKAARDTLLSPTTRRQVDSLLQHVGVQVGHLRDSLVGNPTREHLARIEADLARQVDAIRKQLLGEDTRTRLGLIYSDLGDSLTTITSRIRDELLGERSRTALDSLLASAITTAARGLEQDVLPQLRREQSFLKRNITFILIAVGIVVALLLVLAFWLYRRSNRYRRTVEVMTVQIESVEDPRQRDKLKQGIKLKAVEAKVEPDLKQILKGQGLGKQPTS